MTCSSRRSWLQGVSVVMMYGGADAGESLWFSILSGLNRGDHMRTHGRIALAACVIAAWPPIAVADRDQPSMRSALGTLQGQKQHPQMIASFDPFLWVGNAATVTATYAPEAGQPLAWPAPGSPPLPPDLTVPYLEAAPCRYPSRAEAVAVVHRCRWPRRRCGVHPVRGRAH